MTTPDQTSHSSKEQILRLLADTTRVAYQASLQFPNQSCSPQFKTIVLESRPLWLLVKTKDPLFLGLAQRSFTSPIAPPRHQNFSNGLKPKSKFRPQTNLRRDFCPTINNSRLSD